MSFETVLITGANRGIGLELVRQVLTTTHAKHVIATTRHIYNPELDQLRDDHWNRLHVLQLEIEDFNGYSKFAKQVTDIVGDQGLDSLINAEAMVLQNSMNSVTSDELVENFAVNSVAPLMFTTVLLPLLKVSVAKRKTAVINILLPLSSMSRKLPQPYATYYNYGPGKVAHDMITNFLSMDITSCNIRALCINLGHMNNDMGGPDTHLVVVDRVTKFMDEFKNNINDYVN